MIPVEKNKQYTMEITDVASDGNGVGKIDGYTVFVPNTVTGDTVLVLIVKLKSSHGYGKLISVEKKSPYRIIPPCNSSVRCGGCSFMHISYEYQLKLKEKFICDALRRIGREDKFQFEGIYGMNTPYYYRNKMIFPVGKDKNNKISFGFYANRSHDIVTFDSCLLGNPACSEIADLITEFIRKNNISVYDEQNHTGLVRRIFIRTSTQHEIMVVISINGKEPPDTSSLVKLLTNKFPEITSIILNINRDKTNLVLGKQNVVLYGKDFIYDTVCGNKFSVSPQSFFQVNPSQTEMLYKKCLEYADISASDNVMDIYCGIGTISLAAAKTAKHVIGIEIVPEAIEDARKNAKINNIENAEFYAASADIIVPKLIKTGIKPDIVILDPPRKGSDEKTLSAIVQAAPKRISYVSCNPATLARDIMFLTDRGYCLQKAAGIDMFPHTPHVETVVLLQRQNT